MAAVCNCEIREAVSVMPVDAYLTRRRLQWYGHVRRRGEQEPTQQVLNMTVRGYGLLRWVLASLLGLNTACYGEYLPHSWVSICSSATLFPSSSFSPFSNALSEGVTTTPSQTLISVAMPAVTQPEGTHYWSTPIALLNASKAKCTQ